jgi:hypothetical protein
MQKLGDIDQVCQMEFLKSWQARSAGFSAGKKRTNQSTPFAPHLVRGHLSSGLARSRGECDIVETRLPHLNNTTRLQNYMIVEVSSRSQTLLLYPYFVNANIYNGAYPYNIVVVFIANQPQEYPLQHCPQAVYCSKTRSGITPCWNTTHPITSRPDISITHSILADDRLIRRSRQARTQCRKERESH